MRDTPTDSYLVLLRTGFTIATNCCQLRGALLPHLFTLTLQRLHGGLLSAALSVGSHLPGVTWRSSLWSPDFPRIKSCKPKVYRKIKRDCLANSDATLTNPIYKNQFFIQKMEQKTKTAYFSFEHRVALHATRLKINITFIIKQPLNFSSTQRHSAYKRHQLLLRLSQKT